MLPMPPSSSVMRAAAEVGTRDGVGLDDVHFVVTLTLGVIALMTAFWRMTAPGREMHKEYSKMADAVFGKPADPDHGKPDREPGLIERVSKIETDVAEIKDTLADLNRWLRRDVDDNDPHI